MLNKRESKIPSAIKDIAIVAIGVVIVWVGIRLVFDTTNPFYIVSSGSMVPNLNVDDVLVVREGDSFKSLNLGDIIVFHRPIGGDRVIVHRVADIKDFVINSQEERMIRTKGDANPSSIPGVDYPITEKDYIGKVAFVIPGVGVITRAISPPVNYIIIAAILAILFLSHILRKKDGQPSNPAQRGGGEDGSSPPAGSPF
ncbi:MAG TPA: signal peptidase I [Nitrososphaeraceae archaeon]|nr:signal peptidase I [Nitrososphaeraceae archaeon]